MILKFCFQNEIHRCSDVPTDLSGLRSLLASTFKSQLPENFSLCYTIQNKEEKLPLATQEDYQNLLRMESSKPVRVLICDNASGSADYDVISSQTRHKENATVEESKRNQVNPELESKVEKGLETKIMSEVQKYPYFSHTSAEDEHIRKIVRETLRDEIPLIISLVKDAILKELKVNERLPQQNNGYPKFESEKQVLKVNNDRKPSEGQQDQNLEKNEILYKENAGNEDKQPLMDKIGANQLFTQVKKFGNVLKGQIVEFPEKAMGVIDDWSQKIEGDPYVVVDDEKYPKSVLEKAAGLKDIFPEEDMKVLLGFAKKYPRHATLEQLANLYLAKDEKLEIAAEEIEFRPVEENNQEKNDVIILK